MHSATSMTAFAVLSTTERLYYRNGDAIGLIAAHRPLTHRVRTALDVGQLHWLAGRAAATKHETRSRNKFLSRRFRRRMTFSFMKMENCTSLAIRLLLGRPFGRTGGGKTCKILGDFLPLLTLIANIFGTDHHVESLKIPLSTTTPSTLDQKNW